MMTALKPKRRFGKDYKDEIRISNEALFKGVSTRFGLRTIEKSIEESGFPLLSIRLKSSLNGLGGINLMLAARDDIMTMRLSKSQDDDSI
jgi:hypothetical protein